MFLATRSHIENPDKIRVTSRGTGFRLPARHGSDGRERAGFLPLLTSRDTLVESEPGPILE